MLAAVRYLHIYVPGTLLDWLREESGREGLSISALVRQVLTRYKSAQT